MWAGPLCIGAFELRSEGNSRKGAPGDEFKVKGGAGRGIDMAYIWVILQLLLGDPGAPHHSITLITLAVRMQDIGSVDLGVLSSSLILKDPVTPLPLIQK